MNFLLGERACKNRSPFAMQTLSANSTLDASQFVLTARMLRIVPLSSEFSKHDLIAHASISIKG